MTTIIPIFQRKVSVYSSLYDTTPGRVMTIGNFLTDGSRADDIMLLRLSEDKAIRNRLKRQLPAMTTSGVFYPDRKAEHLRQCSGLMCVDIDGKDNPDIHDMEELKRVLSVLPEVAYISLSVSGRGLFLIIPLRYPSNHRQQFLQLQRDFMAMCFDTADGTSIDGIIIDGACKNINRTRTMSLDRHPYINEQAEEYEGVYVENVSPHIIYNVSDSGMEGTIGKVQALCQQIDMQHVDITQGYDNWFHVGRALASLGEAGRELFHVCSRQNEQYRSRQTDKFFTYLLHHPRDNGIGIGTFFYLCQQYGVTKSNKLIKQY